MLIILQLTILDWLLWLIFLYQTNRITITHLISSTHWAIYINFVKYLLKINSMLVGNILGRDSGWYPCLLGFDSWGEHVAIPWPWVDFRVGSWSSRICRVSVYMDPWYLVDFVSGRIRQLTVGQKQVIENLWKRTYMSSTYLEATMIVVISSLCTFRPVILNSGCDRQNLSI